MPRAESLGRRQREAQGSPPGQVQPRRRPAQRQARRRRGRPRPPRLEPKRKPPGTLRKKREAALGGGGGGSRDLDDAADAAARATKKPKRPPGASDRGGGSQKKKPPPSRKEQKEWSNEQKALQKPNFQLVQTIVGLWERLRVKKIAKSDRRALVDAIFDAAKGKVPEIANNHKGSRVIQALLKHGTPDQCASVYSECVPHVAALAKSLYGHFIVKRLVDATPTRELPDLLSRLRGKIRVLAKHPVGSQVLEHLYHPAPNAEKAKMRVEFYGSEYAFLGAGGLAGGDAGDAPASLKTAMLAKPLAQRQGVLRQVNACLVPILEKGLVSPSLIHRVLAEYLECGGPGTKHEAALSLAGPAFLRMVHTKEGARAANAMFAHAGARHRKSVLKALRGQVARVASDECASASVAYFLETTDDTRLTAKTIVAELTQAGVRELCFDRAARRVFLHALRPRSTRYDHPSVLEAMPDPSELQEAAKKARGEVLAEEHDAEGEKDSKDSEEDGSEGDASDDDGSDGAMDDEFDEDAKESDSDSDPDPDAADDAKTKSTTFRSRAAEAGEDSDEEDGAGGGDGLDFGVPRKDSLQRRREIFGAPGRLGRALVDACASSAAAMLRDAVAGDVLVETCGGGEGGVLLDAVGEEELARLHDAVAEAARTSVAGEEEDDEDEEEDEDEDEEEKKPSSGDRLPEGKKKTETRDKTKSSRLPLHEDYRATRALRRMVLEIPGGACSCDGAPSFARALWEGAASRDVGAWVGGHGAKVVAAVIRAGDAATRKKAMKAVEKAAGVEDAGAWAEGFFKAPGGGGGEREGY